MSGPDWVSGGAYGVEASAVALTVGSVAAALLLRRAQARGKFMPRREIADQSGPISSGA